MNNKIANLFSLVGGALCVAFASSAWANHRSGDFPLPEIMTAGDFNRDGNLDIAANMSGFDNFVVLNGDGQGGFTIKRHIQIDTLSKAVVSGDLNGDGILDVVGVSQWGYNIKVFLGNGAGNFQLSTVLNGDGEPNRLALADLNKDGNVDIIANAPSEGKILIYFGLGGGNFTNTALEIEKFANVFAIEVGDFNNDSNPDIALAYFEDTTSTGSHMQILLGDGAGNFTFGQNIVINPQCNNIRAYDLNKDGKLDLILAGAGADNVAGVFLSTYLGNGTGTFTLKQALDLGTGSIKGQISLADFDEDGNVDVAFPLSANGIMRHDLSTDLLMFYGDGTGNFVQGTTQTVGQEPGSTWAADFNKDGHMDIACTNRTDGTLTILLGNGTRSFTTHATIQLNDLSTP
ncbi:MAG TPA: VCBS repeat-containing protein [Chthoniobacterales bacterium]